ncbi:MAG: acyl-protein synthetase [Deltaproteobacteria bacterium]|nr:acyl-protein synthetase [Deltaproteobacteria bacterium]
MNSQRDRLWKKITALIDRLAPGGRDDRARDALLCEVLAWQAEKVQPYRKLVESSRLKPRQQCRRADSFVALPTEVFRYARVAWHDSSNDRAVFRTSGTTVSARGSHHIFDLSLYDRAARVRAKYALFPDVELMRLFVLAPTYQQAGDSSLSYMLERFIAWFGSGQSEFVWRDDGLDLEKLARALDRAVKDNVPVALLGTSFAFVHAEEGFQEQRWSLPHGSRVMQTGGFKGRSREVQSEVLRASLSKRYGIDEAYIIQEYGMTELCSQMYETTLRDAVERRRGGARRFYPPGWVRASVVDPETLAPLKARDAGLLRIDDLANLDSVCAIQTSDLARVEQDGFVLLGRATGSTPRGCSIVWD